VDYSHFLDVIKRFFREKEHSEMNLWVGPHVTDEIVDEWDEEMQYWSVHYYMSPRYNYVGVGKAWNHRNSCFVVVAMYF
jgi:ABC-type amino acid transport substrate-binding protein